MTPDVYSLDPTRDCNYRIQISIFRHSGTGHSGSSASNVETHLVNSTNQRAHVAGESFSFASGEWFWTEASYRYDGTRFERLVGDEEFRVEKLWTDEANQIWVALPPRREA